MSAGISWTFGELAGLLAEVHSIDPTKKTAFQSRLKNFHRLGYPVGFQAIKGKAASYSPLQVIDMALAVEMTQLGMPPERSSVVLTRYRWSVLMAAELVARELHTDPAAWNSKTGLSEQALSMFLFFDPAALHPLTIKRSGKSESTSEISGDALFKVGAGIVSEDVAGWTNGGSARLSIINLTAMAARVAVSPFVEGSDNDLAYRRDFFRLLEANAAKERSEM